MIIITTTIENIPDDNGINQRELIEFGRNIKSFNGDFKKAFGQEAKQEE
jgi:hypothetical protein